MQKQPDRSRGLGKWWGRQGHEWTSGERLLAAGAAVAVRMRRAVLDECSFTCSAGISHNKILAKLGSGLHKPNQQTILPTHAAAALLRDLPLRCLSESQYLFSLFSRTDFTQPVSIFPY